MLWSILRNGFHTNRPTSSLNRPCGGKHCAPRLHHRPPLRLGGFVASSMASIPGTGSTLPTRDLRRVQLWLILVWKASNPQHRPNSLLEPAFVVVALCVWVVSRYSHALTSSLENGSLGRGSLWINCGAGVFANSTVGSFVQPIVLVPPTPQSEGDARRLDQPLAMPRRFPGHRGTWNPTRAPNLCAAPQLGRVGTRWQCQSIRGWNPHKEVPLSRPMNTQNGSQSSSHSCEHT